MIKNASEWTTIPTMINALHTLPATKEGLAITLSVPALLKLLNASKELSDDDLYSLIEAITTINVGSAISLEDINNILNTNEEEVVSDENAYEAGYNQAIKSNIENKDFFDMSEFKNITDDEIKSYEQGIEDVMNKEQDSIVSGREYDTQEMFDETEPEAQEALEKFQARFNIDEKEPEQEVKKEDDITPELEKQIEDIIKIASF